MSNDKQFEVLELQRQNKALQTVITKPADEPTVDLVDLALQRLKHTLNHVKVIPDSEAAAIERERTIAKLREQWNAPRRHVENKNLDLTVQGWVDTLQFLSSKLGGGFLMALIGTRGPGKTQLGVELMEYAVQKLMSAQYCTAVDFFLAVKATYKKETTATEQDAIKQFVRPRLLVIDEVQERGETAWEDRLLTDLLNRRYNLMHDTLLIANLKESEFRTALGPSIISRMNETGGIIECKWGSFRK